MAVAVGIDLGTTSYFRPEFLNRLDDIVLFKPLTQAEIEHIVDLMLNDLRSRLSERQMTMEITEDARRFLAQQGFAVQAIPTLLVLRHGWPGHGARAGAAPAADLRAWVEAAIGS
jgi:hypothetical protein